MLLVYQLMAIFGQLMLLFSTFRQLMLPYSNDKSKLFNVFIVVVARFLDSLCFFFGQLMVQVAVLEAGLLILEVELKQFELVATPIG